VVQPHEGALYAKRGAVFLGLGDLRGAAACFRRAHKVDPASVVFRRELAAVLDAQGCLHAERGDRIHALACFEEATALDPREPFYFMHLALSLIDNGCNVKALNALDAFVKLDPNDAEALIFRGKLSWKLGYNSRCSRDMSAAKKLMPAHPEVLRFESTLAKDSDTENAGASRLMMVGNHKAAAKQLDAALRMAPHDLRLNQLAAAAHRQQGLLDDAAAYIARAEEGLARIRARSPDGAGALVLARDIEGLQREKALLLNASAVQALRRGGAGAAREGLELLDQALLHWSAGSVLHLHRGDCLRALDNWTAAQQSYEDASECDDGSHRDEIEARKALVAYHFGQAAFNSRQFALACDKFTLAVEAQPHVAEYYVNRAMSLAALGRTPEAYQDFCVVQRLDPANLRARSWLATHRAPPVPHKKSPSAMLPSILPHRRSSGVATDRRHR